MNKSSLFVNAWNIARAAAAKFGGSVKSYFAESLKAAHASVIKKMVVTHKRTNSPCYSQVTITNAAHVAKVFNDWSMIVRGNALELLQVRKRDLDFIISVVEFMNAEKKPDVKKSGRYIELLSIARIKNLNHGRSWICSHYNCIDLGLNSACDGMLNLCYVYPN